METSANLTLMASRNGAHKDPASCSPCRNPGASKSRGAISQLQEYVQDASTPFALPANCSVLQWDLSTRASTSSLEFRATVAFLLEGVPHHVAGIWKPSKKVAQRDAAERALELYAKVDGGTAVEEDNTSILASVVPLRDEQPWYVATTPEDVVFSVPIPSRIVDPRLAVTTGRTLECPPPKEPVRQPPPAGDSLPWPSLAVERGLATRVPLPQRLLPQNAPAALLCAPPGLGAPPGLELLEDTQSEDTQQEHSDLLKDFCDEMGWPHPRFSYKTEGDRCLAMVEVAVLGILHTFSGQLCEDYEAAEEDVAKRVLWYLRAPGSEDAFEPDEDYARKAAQLIPGPPKPDWVKDGVWKDELADRKITIMLVQNRLQHIFAQQIDAGMSVWHWSYERGRHHGADPRLIRAKVTVPMVSRQFVGKWKAGQKDAQIDACSKVVEFLDKEYPYQSKR